MAGQTRFSSIGRPIDPRYPTNQAIVAIAVLAFGAGTIYQTVQGAGTIAALKWGAYAGGTGFLAWALARELDPDHPYAAFIASALALGLLALGTPALLFSFWALLMLRVVNRSCGPPATWLDATLATGLALWLVHQGMWSVGIIMALAFMADGLLPTANPRQYIFAAATLVGTIVLGDSPTGGGLSNVQWGVVIVASLLMLLVIATTRSMQAPGDQTGVPLQAPRVRTAQALALLVATALVLLHGNFTDSMPLWAAMLGVGGYRIWVVGQAARR